MQAPIYLDANASMPPLQEAKDALVSASTHCANPSSPHVLGRAARKRLDEARFQVAKALGGRDKELYFTSGASESNRWLVDALVELGRMQQKAVRVLSSPLEHPSLGKALKAAAAKGEIVLSMMAIDAEGRLDFAPSQLNACDVLVLTAAHNETGIVPDVAALCALIPEHVIVLSDASQAMGRLPILPARVDGIVASAHKMGAFAGVGALLLRGNARRLPMPWAGGGQENGVRSGTEALVLIEAFGAAAAQIERTRAAHQALMAVRDKLEQELCAKWPFARVIGQNVERLPNTSAICLRGIDGDALRIAIDMSGVCVGFGSACSALAPEPSPSLLALGLSPQDARSTVRLSLDPDLNEADIEKACRLLYSLKL